MTLRFLDGNGSGTVADAIAGIDYAIANHADVINASWGGPDFSPPLRDAFARAGAAGITIVAAAGNDGASNDESPTYPAAFNLPNLISVAASDRRDHLANFSNYGSTVDVAAPGVEIVSTEGNGVGYMSGTSMAAPHVAGIAALARGFRPGLSPDLVIASIEAGVRKNASLSGKVKSSGADADPANILGADPHDAIGAMEAIAAAGQSLAIGPGFRAGQLGYLRPGGRDVVHDQRRPGAQPGRGPLRARRRQRDGIPSWYKKTGVGQAGSVQVTAQCNFPPASADSCYSMTDRGTFDNLQSQGTIAGMKVVTEKNTPTRAAGRPC